MNGSQKAEHVCATCKVRKKACDKNLPRCGYCSKRGLECTYEIVSHRSSGVNADSGIPFLTFLKGPQHLVSNPAQTGPELNSSLNPSSTCGDLDLNSILNVHVAQTLTNFGASIHEISEQYFRGFHVWLPLICPQVFREDLSRYIVPPANWSIRTLAMCLLAIRPPSAPAPNSTADRPEPLYVFVKMLLAQVQTELPGSIPLLQAGILVSAYEYACRRPEVAYISLEACVGMAQTLHINNYKQLQANELSDESARLRFREQWNIWWALVILQRLILIELRDRISRPTAEFPEGDFPPPSDLTPSPTSNEHVLDSPKPLTSSTTSGICTSWIARQAQAVKLLDRMFKTINLFAAGDTRVLALRETDVELQSFLRLVMDEPGFENWKIRSAVTATILRSLFALHEEILSLLGGKAVTETQKQQIEASQATISTCTKIVADIASHAMGQGEGSPAPCCIYSSRTARKHAEIRHALLCNSETAHEAATIGALEESLSTKS